MALPSPAMPANVSLTAERVKFPHLCPDRRCNTDLRERLCLHYKTILPDLHGLSNTATIRHLAKLWKVNHLTHEITVRGPLDRQTDTWYVTVTPLR